MKGTITIPGYLILHESGDFTDTHLHLATLVPIIVHSTIHSGMILSISGLIQDITCFVAGIISGVRIMVIVRIIMIGTTRVHSIMDHMGQVSGHHILITPIGEVPIITIPEFITGIPEDRMIFM